MAFWGSVAFTKVDYGFDWGVYRDIKGFAWEGFGIYWGFLGP